MPVLFLIVVVDLIGFGIVIPLLPFYAERYAATPTEIGLLMASYSVAQFVTAPIWGQLSDRVGRRPILLLTMAGAALSYILLGLADSLVLLFIARILSGAMAGNISTAFAYIADVTTPETRARGMGLIGAAFSIGFILGPAIGGILAGSDPASADFATPSYVAAGLSLLSLVLGLVILKESLSPERRAAARDKSQPGRVQALAEAVRIPGIGILLLLSFLATLVFAALEATFALWSHRQFGWGPEQNGYLFAFIGFIAASVQGGLMGPLARHVGTERLIVIGATMMTLGLAAIPFCTAPLQLILAMTVAGLGFSVMSPAMNTAISLRGGAEVQGGLMGVTRSTTTMSRMVGPALGGAGFGMIGLHAPYIAGAAIMALVALIGLRLALRPRPAG